MHKKTKIIMTKKHREEMKRVKNPIGIPFALIGLLTVGVGGYFIYNKYGNRIRGALSSVNPSQLGSWAGNQPQQTNARNPSEQLAQLAITTWNQGNKAQAKDFLMSAIATQNGMVEPMLSHAKYTLMAMNIDMGNRSEAERINREFTPSGDVSFLNGFSGDADSVRRITSGTATSSGFSIPMMTRCMSRRKRIGNR
jgi:hypothetical protein